MCACINGFLLKVTDPRTVLIIGFIISVLVGRFAIEIFKPETKEWRIYQCWFNFIGSFVGWVLVVLLYVKIRRQGWDIGNPSISQLLLFSIALLGITGWLPKTLYGIASSIAILAFALEERLKKLTNSK